ncbi:MAG TPA: outer membrane beta-barrel protein [Hanamia sp.]|nr:outer membrane beta-barrel protein [Hanamia sp.]
MTLDKNKGENEVNTIGNGENIKQHLNSPFLHLTNNLNGIILFHRKYILEYYSYASYHKNPQTLNIIPGVLEEVLNNNIPFKQSVQQANIPAFFTNNYISWHKVSDHFFQNYKLGISYQAQTLNSEIKVQQFDNSINILSDTFSNHLLWHQLKWYAEPELRWQKNKNSISISIPVNFINLSYKEMGLQKYFNRNYLFINPYLKWIYKVDKESNIYLSYNFNNSLGSIDQVYYGIIMKDYRNFYSNDGTMQQSYNNSIGAGLNFNRSIKIFFFNLHTSYGINHHNFINTSVLKNDLIQSVSIPYNNDSRFYTINWNMSKYIFKLKTTLTLKYFFRYDYSKEIQNYVIFPVMNLSNLYYLGIRPKVAGWLNLNYNIEYSRYNTKSKTENKNSSTYIAQLKQNIDIDIFPADQISLKLSGEYYKNKNINGGKISLYFVDASLKYQFKTKPLDIELIFSNITNTSEYYNLSVSQNQVSESSFTLRPKSVLITASYNF